MKARHSERGTDVGDGGGKARATGAKADEITGQ
jgi:hypothetical protein